MVSINVGGGIGTVILGLIFAAIGAYYSSTVPFPSIGTAFGALFVLAGLWTAFGRYLSPLIMGPATTSQYTMKLSNVFSLIPRIFGTIAMILIGGFLAVAVAWWASILFLLVGAAILFTSAYTQIILDKSGNKMSISTRKLTGSSSMEYPVSDIASIRFARVLQGSGKSSRWVPIITFALKSGSELPFESVVPEAISAKKVADFLGVPFSEDKPPSMMDALSAVGGALSAGMKKYQEEMEKPPQNPPA